MKFVKVMVLLRIALVEDCFLGHILQISVV